MTNYDEEFRVDEDIIFKKEHVIHGEENQGGTNRAVIYKGKLLFSNKKEITVAAKYVDKKYIVDAKNEIFFHRDASHKNIARLVHYTESEGKIILFSKYCDSNCQTYSLRQDNEKTSLIEITSQLLEVKKYLQEKNMKHPKIISKHVLFESEDKELKLIDFMDLKYEDQYETDFSKEFNHDFHFCQEDSNFQEIGCLILQCLLEKLNYNIHPIDIPITCYRKIFCDFGMLAHQAAMLSTLVHSLISLHKDSEFFLKHVCFYSSKHLIDLVIDVANLTTDIKKCKKDSIQRSISQEDPAVEIVEIDSSFIMKLESHSKDILQGDDEFIKVAKKCGTATYRGEFKLTDVLLLIRNMTQHFKEIKNKCQEENIKSLFVHPKENPCKFLEPFTCYPLLFVWLWYCTWPISPDCETYDQFHMDYPHCLSSDQKQIFQDLETILFSSHPDLYLLEA